MSADDSISPGQFDVQDYEGTTGSTRHITRVERGLMPTEALAKLHGVNGERPGYSEWHKTGQEWEDFKDRLGREGIQSPAHVIVDHGKAPLLSEGNQRRDYAVERGRSHVPVEVTYFGNAHKQGTLWERHLRGDMEPGQ